MVVQPVLVHLAYSACLGLPCCHLLVLLSLRCCRSSHSRREGKVRLSDLMDDDGLGGGGGVGGGAVDVDLGAVLPAVGEDEPYLDGGRRRQRQRKQGDQEEEEEGSETEDEEGGHRSKRLRQVRRGAARCCAALRCASCCLHAHIG